MSDAAGGASAELTFTGERVIPGLVEPDLWNEHVARYHFAALFAAGKTVLDIGCGVGYGTNLLAASANTALGSDISPEAIQHAIAHASRAKFFVASASALPHPSASIGLVTAFEVIEHIPNWEDLIREAARVLAADGVFIVSTPNKSYYNETRDQAGKNPFHEHEFELEEFRQSLGQAFRHVRMLGQNHQQSVVFSPEQKAAAASAFVPVGDQLATANFFVAVCSQLAVDIPSFAYVPSASNLLRERERHIRLLQAQVDEVIADRANLLNAHRRVHAELDAHNEWALRLERELLRKNTDLARYAAETQEAIAGLRLQQSQTDQLQDQLRHVRASFWMRLGRVLDIGPWTEGRLHLNRLRRWMRARLSPAAASSAKLSARAAARVAPSCQQILHLSKLLFAFILLTCTALVLAAEDLCFRCFGKRHLPEAKRVSARAASVVIPNWNGRDLLERFLPSVVHALSSNHLNEIIVVDNASSDGSAAFVQQHFPQVRVLQMDRNLGFGGGCNAGMRAARNDVVVLLNNDMQVDAQFLAPLLEPFSDPLVFAVSAQIFFDDPAKRREETGLTEVWWERGLLKASHRIDPQIRNAYPCAYPGGGSSAFDRHKFLELGGFDSLFEPFYYEDTDLGFRAWKRGWKVLYQPASVVHHCHRATVRKNFSAAFVQGIVNRNAILYCWKNIHSWKMLPRHLAACLSSGSRRAARQPHQYSAANISSAFSQLRRVVDSRWRALSQASLSDPETFNQPLGGYFRDRFIAPFSPASPRLKVLFVSPYPIEPPLHGGGVFMNQTLTQLCALADVHLVCFLDNEYQLANQNRLREICKSTEFLVRGPVPELSLTLTPLPVRQFADRNFAWLIHRTLLLEQIDVVQVEYTMLGQYAGRYRHIPWLLFEHDVMTQTLQRGLQSAAAFSMDSFLEYCRMRLYEPRMLRQFTRVQVCSQANAGYLRKLAPNLPHLDTNLRAAIDTRQYTDPLPRDLSAILFVGGFAHSPNIQGLTWFLSEIFPRILTVRPDVVLYVVGSNPPAGPNIWDEHPNVRLIGAVLDVRVPLQQAGVFICPILTGSGIRVKLLEAFAAQIPVVSTTIGAEGLASESGEVCELADTPAAFAESVLLLLENQNYRAKLVSRARLLVEREYHSPSATARLLQTYTREVSKVRTLAMAQRTSA